MPVAPPTPPVTPATLATVYARVSTADRGQDPENQLRELREYCARRGWTIVSEYVDSGVSGSKESRPQLNRLMADARAGLFNAVVVWKWDRFARSTAHLLKALEVFQKLKIDFVSLTENVDTATPVGKMVFVVLSAIGELERNLIGERTRCALKHARAKGIRLGRPPGVVDEKRVIKMKSEGLSHRAIARALNIDRSVVSRVGAGGVSA
jgi:DNA invertase Pin-like site-specific DNA recombinase